MVQAPDDTSIDPSGMSANDSGCDQAVLSQPLDQPQVFALSKRAWQQTAHQQPSQPPPGSPATKRGRCRRGNEFTGGGHAIDRLLAVLDCLE